MGALRLSPDLAAWARLSAELVNTRPRATDPAEKLATAGDLDALLAGAPEPVPGGPRDLDAMRALRPALLAAFEADDLDGLAAAANPLLARAGAWRMARAGPGWAIAPDGEPGLADWFGARAAQGLAELAIAYGAERLHVCRADDCFKAVADVSRNGTRRYCSRTCANRVNARRHRAGG